MIRKSTPKVKDGRVQKKNRHVLTPNYWNTRQEIIQIDVQSPGKGYKHFLKKRDIIKFLEILPNFEEICESLDAIILASAGDSCDGWYNNGVIGICAWDKNMTCSLNKNYFQEHKDIFERLNLEYDIKKEVVVCYFKENQIIAYQLLHIMLHEIGHHYDRIKTKHKNVIPNGEKFAEDYAVRYEKIIWNRYFDYFKY